MVLKIKEASIGGKWRTVRQIRQEIMKIKEGSTTRIGRTWRRILMKEKEAWFI